MNKRDLLPVLKEACKYVPKKCTLPVLKTLHIEVVDGEMTVYATNLEDYFTCTIPTDCADMDILVPAKTFRDQINVMDGGDIKIGYLPEAGVHIMFDTSENSYEMHDEVVSITQGRSNFLLWSEIPVVEFPPSHDGMLDEVNWTVKDVTVASGAVATIYHQVPDADRYIPDSELKSKANKLFPKYLKIEGVLAKKNKSAAWDWSDKKYYCYYQYGECEQKIYLHELENYEAVELGKRGRK